MCIYTFKSVHVVAACIAIGVHIAFPYPKFCKIIGGKGWDLAGKG